MTRNRISLNVNKQNKINSVTKNTKGGGVVGGVGGKQNIECNS
jgi:hypothetical protein